MHKVFESLILDTDSYKISHWKQYPKGTEYVYSYIEPRVNQPEIVSMGVQSFVKEYLLDRITKEDVDYAERLLLAHGMPFNRTGWMDIVRKHNGYLPISIRALPDGTVFNGLNAQAVVVNTDPSAYWLTSYIETALLRSVWYQSTVATNSRNIKKVIKKYAEISSENPDDIDFKFHDFGARGATSKESAMLGGMAHLVNFMGTDTIGGLIGAMKYYGDIENPENCMPGFSIPASEHSTMTSWGRENEVDAYRNMLTVYGGEGKILACVSDSYDYFNAVENLWGSELKEEIEKMGGTLVIRPDSGDSLRMVLFTLKKLQEIFGTTVNSKGYTVLNPCVRIIQGDGLTFEKIEEILDVMVGLGCSTDNIAFGMGGSLLQGVTRDTLKYAMKCCAVTIDGKVRDVFKNPVTQTDKKSKKGILYTHKNEDGIFYTDNNPKGDMLEEIFQCGRLIRESTFSEVRARAKV